MKYRNHLLLLCFLLVSFSTYFFISIRIPSLTPEVIKDNLQTGAKKLSRIYTQLEPTLLMIFPKKGLSESFWNQIRKNKRSKYFNGSRSVLQILEVEHWP